MTNNQTLRIYLFSILLLLGGLPTVYAQYTVGGLPASLADKGVGARVQTNRGLSTVPASAIYKMASLDTMQIIKQETNAALGNNARFRVLNFAIDRAVSISPSGIGEIFTNDQGTRIWRMKIKSNGAYSLGFKLERFRIPQGGKLFFYNEYGAIHGAYTEENNNPDMQLQISPIEGDEVTIEYNFPQGYSQATGADVPFVISHVYHDYKGLKRLYNESVSRLGGSNVGEPWFELAGLNCIPNVKSFPETDKQARSVTLIIVNGTTVCSGALINNLRNDGTPYLLTASHCVNNIYKNKGDMNYIHNAVKTMVFFFGFQSQIPEKYIRATEELTLSGAELVALDETSDMCLVKITGVPSTKGGLNKSKIPAEYNPYFSGWNISTDVKGSHFGIHHPLASVKRYSMTTATLTLDDFITEDQNRMIKWHKHHWLISKWDIGCTAGGSSGSPLFDQDGLIIGALTGGASSCASPANDAYYAIYTAWNKRTEAPMENQVLSAWLDPDHSGAKQCNGFDPLEGHPLVRHSGVLGSVYNQDIEAALPGEGVRGIGNRYDLDPGTRILGAYVVFKGNQVIAGSFPQLKVALREVQQNGEVEGSAGQWHTIMGYPGYSSYDFSSSGFNKRPRTISADSLEVFIPLRDNQGKYIDINQGGKYQLSVELNAGNKFTLPVFRLRDGFAHRRIAYVQEAGGKWINASEYPSHPYDGAYWIDLVTQSSFDHGKAPTDTSMYDSYIVKCDGRRLMIQSKRPALGKIEDLTKLSVYHMSGIRAIYLKLESSVTYIDLASRLPRGVYIVQIEDSHGKHTTKVEVSH
ncbi:trypsin-like peptidase domain-containing protein [Porphyromonas pogonae]|uniref:trypsin-like peptidase domain-containing protein n=1 Tax=Porphyromonas pogonae TaxID=867595 RepID=UPI002E77F299|nr:trypsin-like peptidase domain-containing protein [Porphyromonas pogonae]